MMILIIDANILIAELLHQRGRELLRNQKLMIYAAESTRYWVGITKLCLTSGFH